MTRFSNPYNNLQIIQSLVAALNLTDKQDLSNINFIQSNEFYKLYM